MTDSTPWARITNVKVSEDGAILVLDFAGQEINTPLIPRDKCPTLALAMIALSQVDKAAAIQLPVVGTFRLGNLEDAGGLLLALIPGDLATKGLAGLISGL